MGKTPMTWQTKRDRRYFLVRDLVKLILSDRRLAVEFTQFPDPLFGNMMREVRSIVDYRLQQPPNEARFPDG